MSYKAVQGKASKENIYLTSSTLSDSVGPKSAKPRKQIIDLRLGERMMLKGTLKK
jgi:hypothetical protein